MRRNLRYDLRVALRHAESDSILSPPDEIVAKLISIGSKSGIQIRNAQLNTDYLFDEGLGLSPLVSLIVFNHLLHPQERARADYL